MRRHIREVIVVEGRYDKNAVKQVVDATVVETGGFGVFKDRERLALLRRLAAERGLILLTDSDGAGFVIRGKLASHIPPEYLKHAYIPDVYGKERRKAKLIIFFEHITPPLPSVKSIYQLGYYNVSRLVIPH